jgi:hypothetical protein
MEISVSMPLDDDGYLRRACPSCNRALKWFAGESTEQPPDLPEPERYYCPYCGAHADADQWWTAEQIAYAQAIAGAAALQSMEHEMERTFGKIPGITYQPARSSTPNPLPLSDQNDMAAVASPCHGFAPFKIDETWDEPIHCILCGERFAV